MTVDGHTYDRANIAKWLDTHDTSPKTGERLDSKQLIPNLAIRSMLKEHEQRQDELRRRLKKRHRFTKQQVPASSSKVEDNNNNNCFHQITYCTRCSGTQ